VCAWARACACTCVCVCVRCVCGCVCAHRPAHTAPCSQPRLQGPRPTAHQTCASALRHSARSAYRAGGGRRLLSTHPCLLAPAMRAHTHTLSPSLSSSLAHTCTRLHAHISFSHTHTLSYTHAHTHTRTQIHVHSCTTQLRPFRQALVSAPSTGHTHTRGSIGHKGRAQRPPHLENLELQGRSATRAHTRTARHWGPQVLLAERTAGTPRRPQHSHNQHSLRLPSSGHAMQGGSWLMRRSMQSRETGWGGAGGAMRGMGL